MTSIKTELWYILATFRHWTDYNGLVDIYVEKQKNKLRAAGAECFCQRCIISNDILYARYYSCLKNNNLENGSILLESGVGPYLAHGIITHLEKSGIVGNSYLFLYYFRRSGIAERRGKLRALYQIDLKKAIEKLKQLDTFEYNSNFEYDRLEINIRGSTNQVFVEDRKINPIILEFLMSLAK